MKKNRSTKRALLMSALSMVLCLSMLVGSTFAWFTDSVTSSGNIIKSGTLDVEMYWADGTLAVPADESTDWNDASTGAIFDYENWEPGYAMVRHIKIENKGSLALKYYLQIIPDGELSKLTDVIDVYYMDPAEQVAKRSELIDSDKLGNLTQALASMANTANGKLEAGESVTLTLALKMQETAGNEYQGLTTGKFAIQLMATQVTNESDSFDDQYDKDSKYPVLENVAKEENKAATVGTDVVEIEIPAEAPAGDYIVEVANKSQTEDAAGNTTVAMDITLKKDGKKVVADGTAYTVSVNVGAGKNIVGATHNGQPITYQYNPATGILTFVTSDFSPFAFTYEDGGFVAATETKGYATLAEAIEAAKGGETITLLKDIAVANNETITIDAGSNVVLDLNRHKLSGTADKTGNQELFLVKGNLTVKNGSMEYTAANNQGWNSMATIFDVTAGGVLNMEEVKATVSGTDMNFIVHLNNWGSATLNVNNCDFTASYVAVRAFNSGYDMNTVTIKNTDFHGGRMFWVHNYTAEGKDDSTLTLNIYGNGNTSDNAKPVRFGFSDSTYYNLEGQQLVTATTLDDVMAAAKKGNVIIDAQGANLGDFSYDGTFGNGTVLKNAKFTYVYGASVDGVATFENCEFVSDHSYSANFSDGSYTGKVIFNNCYFDGWNSFGTTITYVEMNNCTFETVVGPYSLLRFYQDAELNNCEIKDSFDGIDTNETGTVVKLNNCIGIEGKIYNNTDNGTVKVGKWIVDGVELTDVPAW